VLDRLPLVSSLKRDVVLLQQALYQRRAPRVVVLGSVESGRSVLMNALLGKEVFEADRPAAPPGEWLRIEALQTVVDWLELDAETPPKVLEELLRGAVSKMDPDVLVFICGDSEIEESLGARVDVLSAVLSSLQAQLGRPVPFAAIAAGGGDDDGGVIGDLLAQKLRAALSAAHLVPAVVLCTPLLATDGGLVSDPSVVDLSDAIVRAVPDSGRLEAARAFNQATTARRELASAIVHACAAVSLTVGLTPIPLSDAFVIGPLQGVMVSAVIHVSGRSWNVKTVSQWIASLGVIGGAGLGLRWTAQQLVKLIPGAGSLVSAGVAGAGTAALGQSAIAYFLGKRALADLPSGEQGR